jgi:hypothetical protein
MALPELGNAIVGRGLQAEGTFGANERSLFLMSLSPNILCLQLRVIRAFKSTLEDMEEKRSVHSLHSLHSLRSSRSHQGTRPMPDISYIDEDPTKTPSPLTENLKASGNSGPRFGGADRPGVRWSSNQAGGQGTLSPHRHISRTLLPELPELVHETSI